MGQAPAVGAAGPWCCTARERHGDEQTSDVQGQPNEELPLFEPGVSGQDACTATGGSVGGQSRGRSLSDITNLCDASALGLSGGSSVHPSAGSALHAEGLCKRCCFFPKGRCLNGSRCDFCHYGHERRKYARRRSKSAAEGPTRERAGAAGPC